MQLADDRLVVNPMLTGRFHWLETEGKTRGRMGVILSFDHGYDLRASDVRGDAVPVFGVFNADNTPMFRDGSPWPAGILGTGPNAAGEKIVNARILWDAGVVYGFGTDTTYDPRAGLYHELKALNVMFSPQDILRLMGPNTAAFIDREAELGTLAHGKLADIVLVEGDPLELVFALLDVAVVVKGGRVVVDAR
mgnify:CR=1 FL=1